MHTQDASQQEAAEGMAQWMGSLMEQHLLARHLAAKASGLLSGNDLSMPAPMHGQASRRIVAEWSVCNARMRVSQIAESAVEVAPCHTLYCA